MTKFDFVRSACDGGEYYLPRFEKPQCDVSVGQSTSVNNEGKIFVNLQLFFVTFLMTQHRKTIWSIRSIFRTKITIAVISIGELSVYVDKMLKAS